MVSLLSFYTTLHSYTYREWGASALQVSVSMGRGCHCSRELARLVQQFIEDRTFLPTNPYGDWNQSMLVDQDLANDINLYLQEIGKDITVMKLVHFLAHPEVKEKHRITKKISE